VGQIAKVTPRKSYSRFSLLLLSPTIRLKRKREEMLQQGEWRQTNASGSRQYLVIPFLVNHPSFTNPLRSTTSISINILHQQSTSLHNPLSASLNFQPPSHTFDTRSGCPTSSPPLRILCTLCCPWWEEYQDRSRRDDGTAGAWRGFATEGRPPQGHESVNCSLRFPYADLNTPNSFEPIIAAYTRL